MLSKPKSKKQKTSEVESLQDVHDGSQSGEGGTINQGWDHETSRKYMEEGRKWLAVQLFYGRLVAGAEGWEKVSEEALCPAVTRARSDPPDAFEVQDQLGVPFKWRTFLAYRGKLSPWDSGGDGCARKIIESALTTPLWGNDALCKKGVAISVAWHSEQDATVTGQVISFTTETDHPPKTITQLLNNYVKEVLSGRIIVSPRNYTGTQLNAYWSQRVPREFCARDKVCLRRFIYLLPLRTSVGVPGVNAEVPSTDSQATSKKDTDGELEALALNAPEVNPADVHRLLQPLVNKELNYIAFYCQEAAMDTFSNFNCTIRSATARSINLTEKQGGQTDMMCVEVSGDRFLRHMVRILVATAIREAVPGAGYAQAAGDKALLHIVQTKDPKLAAPAAKATGLCFVGAKYE